MSEILSNLFYSKEHEWVEVLSDTKVRIGITYFAQEQLGDIVFVELPNVGTTITAGESMGSVESVKTVSDLYSPVSGNVVAVNSELENAPEKVNEGPYTNGWMVEVEISGADALNELLKPEEYEALVV